eukprot:s391_g5.t1
MAVDTDLTFRIEMRTVTPDQKRYPRQLFCFRLPSRIGRRFLSETLANGFGRANVDADAFLPRCSCPCEAMP